MKVRSDYVTNSSSTSYIISGLQKPDVCPHCGRADQTILDLIKYAQDSCLEVEGRDAVAEWYKNEFFWRGKWEDDGYEEKHRELLALPDDSDVMLLIVDHHDEFLMTALRDAVKNGSIKSHLSWY